MKRNDFLLALGISKNRCLLGPKRLEIEILNYCNINCYFCWFHSPLVKKTYKKWHIEPGTFKKIVDQAKNIGIEHFYITARGEPCLHPDFASLLRYAREKGFFITITTNLTVRNKETLSALALADNIEVTLSAYSEENYKKIHSPLSINRFNNVIKNILFLNKICKAKSRPRIKVNYIVTKLNKNNPRRFVELMAKLGVKDIRFSPFGFIEETKNIRLKEKDLRIFQEEINRMAKNISISIDNSWKDLNSKESKKLTKCYMGWITVLIEVFGTVKIGCMDPLSPVAGNIYKKTLKEIWFSQKANDIRVFLKDSLDSYGKTLHCPFYYFNLEIEKLLPIKKFP